MGVEPSVSVASITMDLQRPQLFPGHATRAWMQPVPGCNPCVDATRAWMQPVPGYNPCLDATRAWMQPVPGCTPCLDATP